MIQWKLNIFVRAIKARMALEGKVKEDLITEYVLLTEEEKTEILSHI